MRQSLSLWTVKLGITSVDDATRALKSSAAKYVCVPPCSTTRVCVPPLTSIFALRVKPYEYEYKAEYSKWTDLMTARANEQRLLNDLRPYCAYGEIFIRAAAHLVGDCQQYSGGEPSYSPLVKIMVSRLIMPLFALDALIACLEDEIPFFQTRSPPPTGGPSGSASARQPGCAAAHGAVLRDCHAAQQPGRSGVPSQQCWRAAAA